MVRQRKKHHFWRNLLILIVLFGIYLYWGNSSIETDEATFTSGALPAGFDGCRIVHLSDLHGKYFGKDNERLYRAVKAAQPEYIFVIVQGADPTEAEALLDSSLLSNPAWSTLTAVQEGRYHVLDNALYNLKPNARWGEAYEELSQILYP